MKKSDVRKVDSEWKLILKNHPNFARVLLAQQAILIEASQLGDKSVDFNMCQVINSNLPVIFRNYWADRCHQDFGNIQISPQLSCILDAEDGNPAACFNMNPDDSWLDVPPSIRSSSPPGVFPVQSAAKAEQKAAPKKTTARSTKKPVSKATKKR